jgi:hypothetical protein
VLSKALSHSHSSESFTSQCPRKSPQALTHIYSFLSFLHEEEHGSTYRAVMEFKYTLFMSFWSYYRGNRDWRLKPDIRLNRNFKHKISLIANFLSLTRGSYFRSLSLAIVNVKMVEMLLFCCRRALKEEY